MPFGGLLSAGISAGGSALGGLFGGKGAKSAAKQQNAALQKAIGLQGSQVDANDNDIWTSQGWANNAINDAKTEGQKAVGDATLQGLAGVKSGVSDANQTLSDSQKQQLALYNPYIQSGTTSLASLQDLAGANGPLSNKFSFNPSDLQNDPGYAFTLQQGQDALQRAAAAKGQLFSSGTLKSLAGYTTGTANQYFGDAFNRAKTTFDTNQNQALSRISTLQGLAGLGYSGTAAGAKAVGDTSSQQAGNTLSGSEFGANLGEQGAQFNSNTGAAAGTQLSLNTLAGAAARNAQGNHYADTVGNLLTNQGNNNAASTVSSTNSWLSALNNGTNATLSYLAGRTPKTAGSTTAGVPNYDPTNAQSNISSYDEFS